MATVDTTASNNANKEVIFNDFTEAMQELSKKAKKIGNKHNDSYIKCYGLALEQAIKGGNTGTFEFAFDTNKCTKMHMTMVEDYKERGEIFSAAVALCDVNFPDFIKYEVEKKAVECLRLILILTIVFQEKKITNIELYFKGIQRVLGESAPK